MRNKRTPSQPDIVAAARDRRLALELEQIGEPLERYMLGALVGSESTPDREPANRRDSRDTALPFLIFLDTRLN